MMYNYTKRLCKYCKEAMMEISDIDYNFIGNQDEYLYCPKCNSYLFVKIRYGKQIFCKWDNTERKI